MRGNAEMLNSICFVRLGVRIQLVSGTHYKLTASAGGVCKWREDLGSITPKAKRR
jgi:hypothetical protein